MAKAASNKGVFIFFVTALVFLVPAVDWSRPISVGGTVLEIPDPLGFTPVTPEMTTLYRVLPHYTYPGNECHMWYIGDSEVQKALKGEVFTFDRRFSVQTPKPVVDAAISKSHFSSMKEVVKRQMDDVMKKTNRLMPGFMENSNKGMVQDFGVDLAISVSEMVALPPHEETDRTLAFSMFMKVGSRGSEPNVIVCTNTLVHVKAKVLWLYSYAESTGRDWTREISKQWADSIVAANPLDAVSAISESGPPEERGTDWGWWDRRAQGAVVAAATATIAFSGRWVWRRIKRKNGKGARY